MFLGFMYVSSLAVTVAQTARQVLTNDVSLDLSGFRE